jgi:hypothetical protein
MARTYASPRMADDMAVGNTDIVCDSCVKRPSTARAQFLTHKPAP